MPSKLPLVGYLVLLAAVVISFSCWRHAERKAGATEILLAQSQSRLDSVRHAGRVQERKLIHDTTVVFRAITRYDTLLQHRIDTAVVTRSDTVTITVREAVAIQDTLRACRMVGEDCARFGITQRQRAEEAEAQVALLKTRQCSDLKPWIDRTIGFALGLAIPRK